MAEIIYPKYRWFVLLSMIVITASGHSANIGAAPLVGEVAATFGTSLGETTAMSMMVYMLAAATSCLLSGFIIDKIGFVRVWIISLSVLLIASLLMSVTSYTPTGYTLTRMLQGLANGPITAVIAAVCQEWFAYKERSYVAAAQGFAVWVGLSLGLVYTPAMLNITNNWHTALSWSAAPCAVSLVFAAILYFGPKPPVVTPVSVKEQRDTYKVDFKIALSTATTFILFALAILDTWYQQAFNDMAPGFYSVQPPVGLGLGPMGAGSKLMWAGYASMLGGLIAPVVVEKLFKGKPRIPLFIACTLSAVFMLCMRFMTAQSGVLLILLPALMLFFSSFVNPTIMGFIAKHYPHSVAGRIGGIASGMAIVGAVIGLLVGSAVLHVTGAYYIPMVIMAGIIFVAGIAVAFLEVPKAFQASKSSES
ncbi:MFS transporter [Aminipila butyrica]|uniref:MFS transporter n=1 Tax=Aminipila butyrica TaxID=433296 RepID=A0A858BXA2_9FIRM|nr:MFS transporter [Aminipila butyrica]QIB68706.1 MFS transporter [Aminipila butyrica]